MYPDRNSPGYGVFVKNVADGLESYDIIIKYKAVIKGKTKNKCFKIIKYIKFYLDIILHFFQKYDIIYVHYPNLCLPILLPLLKIKYKAVIVNLHGEDLFYSPGYWSILGHLNETFLSRYALKIIVPSCFFKEEVLRRKICTEDRIFVSPSGGINPDILYPDCEDNLKDIANNIVLGFVGRIDAGKGWKEYVEAIYMLSRQINIEGIIIGYGSMIEDLKRLIASYHLQNIITIIPGVDQKELRKYYCKFNLLLFTTQLPESLGLVGIESMACGIPVVGTALGGILTYVRDKYNGYLVDKGDIYAIHNAVLDYIHLPLQKKVEMRCNCISTAKEYYSTKVIKELSEILKTYQNVYFEAN